MGDTLEEITAPQDYGGQYSYFKEDLDPRFPTTLLDELKISIFCDSDHNHDKETGWSITGLLSIVDSTPTTWSAKRQTSVQTSTFGAEFIALKRAVKEEITIRYHLRSMGVKVTEATEIYADNTNVILNTTNTGSTWNKKHVALACHFCREHIAAGVVRVCKKHTDENFADLILKHWIARNFTDFSTKMWSTYNKFGHRTLQYAVIIFSLIFFHISPYTLLWDFKYMILKWGERNKASGDNGCVTVARLISSLHS